MKTASARHCSKGRSYQHNINIKSNYFVLYCSVVSFVLAHVGAFFSQTLPQVGEVDRDSKDASRNPTGPVFFNYLGPRTHGFNKLG
jgi:hypothetical protein